jgi:hypothetical protein
VRRRDRSVGSCYGRKGSEVLSRTKIEGKWREVRFIIFSNT